MLRKQLQRRQDENKESNFEVRGRRVQTENLERLAKRKGISDKEILEYDIGKKGLWIER
jgi:hypothetical protein